MIDPGRATTGLEPRRRVARGVTARAGHPKVSQKLVQGMAEKSGFWLDGYWDTGGCSGGK
jgi:hypothetical protein